ASQLFEFPLNRSEPRSVRLNRISERRIELLHWSSMVVFKPLLDPTCKPRLVDVFRGSLSEPLPRENLALAPGSKKGVMGFDHPLDRQQARLPARLEALQQSRLQQAGQLSLNIGFL